MLKKVSDDEREEIVVNEIAKHKADKRKLAVLKQTFSLTAAITVALIIIVAFFLMTHIKYGGYRVLQSNETAYENSANYIEFAGNLLKYTGDGVSCINGNGDVVWSTGISMKMPVATICQDYAVVADVGGNSVCVFGKNGLASSQVMPYTICDVDVASQGAFAVVLESEKTNYINLYNKSGSIIYEAKTSINKTGYPLDISISNDGQKLFVSYVEISGAKVNNKLVAYNFGSVGQNTNADRIMGEYNIEDEVVTKVEFTDNDTIVAFGTDKIRIYSMKEKPYLKSTIDVKGEIRSIFYNKEYVGIIQNVVEKYIEDDTENTGSKYRITVYNLNGREKFSESINFAYNTVYAAEKEIIITGGQECLIYRINGSVKFRESLDGVITSVIPSGKKLEYIVVYKNATDIIHLQLRNGKKLVATNQKGEVATSLNGERE